MADKEYIERVKYFTKDFPSLTIYERINGILKYIDILTMRTYNCYNSQWNSK